MVKAQCLIAFLIFNIPDYFCRNSLEEEESFVEFGVSRKTLYDYNRYQTASCWEMIVEKPPYMYEVQPFIGNNVCNGKITTCAWLGDTTACVSTVGRSKIQWINATRNGRFYAYGESDNCPQDAGVELYRSADHRSVCVCSCFQTNWAIHVGLMRSRESDNYVITGIRFILRDNVLYLQPAEGKLEDNFTISGFSWIPLPIELSKIHRVVDPASVNFFLDDLILDEGYALTGVRFKYIEVTNPKMIKGFGISVSGRPFLHEGKLALRPRNMLTIEPQPTSPRHKVFKVPAEFNRMREFISNLSRMNYEYVELSQSSYEDDFGESTLPLFRNPFGEHRDALLSGFGIFHETTPAKKHFISLRVHPRSLNQKN